MVLGGLGEMMAWRRRNVFVPAGVKGRIHVDLCRKDGPWTKGVRGPKRGSWSKYSRSMYLIDQVVVGEEVDS